MPSQIIFIPLPFQGHVAPMLYLSAALARKLGVIITIINTDPAVDAALQRTWRSTPGCDDIRFECLPIEPAPDPADILAIAKALIRLQKPLADLIRSIHLRGDPKVACVISDFFHHSAALAAQDAGIPSVALFCGMASWASIDVSTSNLILNGDIPAKADGVGGEKLITYIPGLKMRSRDLPHYFQEPHFSQEGLETLLHRLKRLNVDSWVLVDSVYEFEEEVFDRVKAVLEAEFVPIGPLFPGKDMSPVSLRAEDKTCLEWLDKQAPNSVLYISFGSLAVISSVQFRELALGVETSGQRFLWINRSGLVSEMDDTFYQEFLERTRDRGMISEWCPQLEVLQHGSTGGFLTHSGWNSVKEGIIAGVPMLGYPFLLDQMLNTRMMIEGKGLGLCLERGADGVVSRDEVETKIRVVMEDTTESNEFRNKAGELSKVARDATQPGGSSHASLQDFISKFLLGCV